MMVRNLAVIISTWGKTPAGFVEQCIRSLAEQTFPFMTVFCFDHPRHTKGERQRIDNALKILEKGHILIRYEPPEHMGGGEAYNKAVRIAAERGADYIYPMGSDDYFSGDKFLEALASAIGNRDVSDVLGGHLPVGATANDQWYFMENRELAESRWHGPIMLPTSVYLEFPFLEGREYGCDGPQMTKMVTKYHCVNVPLAVLRQTGFHVYRIHNSNISHISDGTHKSVVEAMKNGRKN